MKKQLIILSVSAALVLGGCGASSGRQRAAENPYYQCYLALDQGQWEEAARLFQNQLKGEEKDYIALLGLAKAQLGAGRLEEAAAALEEAYAVYPQESQTLAYQGEVYGKMGNYEAAVESYRILASAREDNAQAKERLTEYLWKLDDYSKIYEISKELYQQDPRDKDFLIRYVWSAACTGEEAYAEDLLDTLKGSQYEYGASAVVNAYRLAKAGDMESARGLLFDGSHIDEFSELEGLYFGETADGESRGLTVGIQEVFGEKGAVMGLRTEDSWNGSCEAWYGEKGTLRTRRDGTEYKGSYLRNICFSGEWEKGAPAGAIFMTVESTHSYPDLPDYNSTDREETLLNFQDGKAEGRTETSFFYQEDGGTWRKSDSVLIHEFKEGEAQPFLAQTEDGEKMVYEFEKYGYGYSWYIDRDCGCAYIWQGHQA